MNNTLSELVGQRLRIARQAAGFRTARSFAEVNQIAQSTYSQYETGKRQFSIHMFARLSKSLNVNTNWLLFGKPPMFNPAEQQQTASAQLLCAEKE